MKTNKVILSIVIALATITAAYFITPKVKEKIEYNKFRNEFLLLGSIVEEIDFEKVIEEHTYESNGKLFVSFTTFSTSLPYNLNQEYWRVVEKYKDHFIIMAAEEYERQAFENGYRHYMFEEEYNTAGEAPAILLDDAMYVKVK